MAGDEDARVEAIRKRTQVRITHPDRVLFPAADAATACRW